MSSLLILCTGNSCRSQMAEGLARDIAGRVAPDVPFKVESAGVEAHGLNPRAVSAMAEIGLDISQQTSNRVDDFLDEHFDLVLTVCDNARERCPFFPGATRTIHHSFDDPADATGSEEEIMAVFARVRDEIAAYLEPVIRDMISA